MVVVNVHALLVKSSHVKFSFGINTATIPSASYISGSKDSFTQSTRATYAVAWNKYKEYTLLNGYSTIPVTFETLVNWIAHLSELNRPESIRQYIAAIRSHLIDRGQSTAALDDPRISRMIKGALRIHGIQPVRERLEITKDILLKMLATIDSSTLNNLNIYASFCVAFAGFCRPSEVTWEQ